MRTTALLHETLRSNGNAKIATDMIKAARPLLPKPLRTPAKQHEFRQTYRKLISESKVKDRLELAQGNMAAAIRRDGLHRRLLVMALDHGMPADAFRILQDAKKRCYLVDEGLQKRVLTDALLVFEFPLQVFHFIQGSNFAHFPMDPGLLSRALRRVSVQGRLGESGVITALAEKYQWKITLSWLDSLVRFYVAQKNALGAWRVWKPQIHSGLKSKSEDCMRELLYGLARELKFNEAMAIIDTIPQASYSTLSTPLACAMLFVAGRSGNTILGNAVMQSNSDCVDPDYFGGLLAYYVRMNDFEQTQTTLQRMKALGIELSPSAITTLLRGALKASPREGYLLAHRSAHLLSAVSWRAVLTAAVREDDSEVAVWALQHLNEDEEGSVPLQTATFNILLNGVLVRGGAEAGWRSFEHHCMHGKVVPDRVTFRSLLTAARKEGNDALFRRAKNAMKAAPSGGRSMYKCNYADSFV